MKIHRRQARRRRQTNGTVGRACCCSPLSSDKINLFYVCVCVFVCGWTCICVRTFCVCFLFVFHFTFVPFRSWVTNQLFIVCWQKTSAGTLTDSLVCNRHILLIRCHSPYVTVLALSHTHFCCGATSVSKQPENVVIELNLCQLKSCNIFQLFLHNLTLN